MDNHVYNMLNYNKSQEKQYFKTFKHRFFRIELMQITATIASETDATIGVIFSHGAWMGIYQPVQQRWINVDSTSIFNVVSMLKNEVGFESWMDVVLTLFQCCFDVVSTLYRRCFNLVSTLFQFCINVYPTFYQPSNNLLFWSKEYVFFNQSYKKPFLLIQITINHFSKK